MALADIEPVKAAESMVDAGKSQLELVFEQISHRTLARGTYSRSGLSSGGNGVGWSAFRSTRSADHPAPFASIDAISMIKAGVEGKSPGMDDRNMLLEKVRTLSAGGLEKASSADFLPSKGCCAAVLASARLACRYESPEPVQYVNPFARPSPSPAKLTAFTFPTQSASSGTTSPSRPRRSSASTSTARRTDPRTTRSSPSSARPASRTPGRRRTCTRSRRVSLMSPPSSTRS